MGQIWDRDPPTGLEAIVGDCGILRGRNVAEDVSDSHISRVHTDTCNIVILQ